MHWAAPFLNCDSFYKSAASRMITHSINSRQTSGRNPPPATKSSTNGKYIILHGKIK